MPPTSPAPSTLCHLTRRSAAACAAAGFLLGGVMGTGSSRPATAPAGADGVPAAWHGLDLAKAPVSTDPALLPDVFVEQPAGSGSYHWRKDVVVVNPPGDDDHTALYLAGLGVFYVKADSPLASSMHFYGPFVGDPRQLLNAPKAAPATRPVGRGGGGRAG